MSPFAIKLSLSILYRVIKDAELSTTHAYTPLVRSAPELEGEILQKLVTHTQIKIHNCTQSDTKRCVVELFSYKPETHTTSQRLCTCILKQLT